MIAEAEGKIDDAWFKDGFQTYKKPAQEHYEIADQDGSIETLEGPVKYKAGYYILTGPKGERYPIPPEKFAELKEYRGERAQRGGVLPRGWRKVERLEVE